MILAEINHLCHGFGGTERGHNRKLFSVGAGMRPPLGDDNQQFDDGSSGASRDITLGLVRGTFGLEAWAPVEPHGCSVLELGRVRGVQ